MQRATYSHLSFQATLKYKTPPTHLPQFAVSREVVLVGWTLIAIPTSVHRFLSMMHSIRRPSKISNKHNDQHCQHPRKRHDPGITFPSLSNRLLCSPLALFGDVSCTTVVILLFHVGGKGTCPPRVNCLCLDLEKIVEICTGR